VRRHTSTLQGVPRELADLNAVWIPNHGSVRGMLGWSQVRVLGSRPVRRTISHFNPDIVVARIGALPLPYRFFPEELEVPYVLKTAGDLSFGAFYGNHRGGRLLARLNQAMVDRIVQGATCIDFVSTAQRELARDLYPDLEDRLHVVDNGVDLDQFRPAPGASVRSSLGFGDSDIVIGYVGNLPMQRGGKEVIDTVAHLQHLGNVKGLVVGDSGEAVACRRHAEERSVSDRVVVYGEADYGDVADLMAAMDVGLSILRSKERGASEQKVRQYLATGLCVVGTRGSNDFLAGMDFARVVASEDLREVAAAVESFVTLGREGRSQLGLEARAFAEAELSFAKRNDRRIRIWETALSSPEAES
jgi:glycosyltransferase involved in cell wall biosynthesis